MWPSDDPEAIISLNRKVYPENQSGEDSVNPYTTTPTAWALNNDIPALRIRHPLNTTGIGAQKKSLVRDFLILPYQYGMAIEYNGIVECWVGEWSIHKGLNYWDPEGNGNGWGGVLWVGDDIDGGGVRSTARNNTTLGGNIAYGELSVEKFSGASNGDFRLRLPSPENQFHFVYGSRGSNNVVAKMKPEGLVLPTIAGVVTIAAPEQAQLVFDSSVHQFKGYNGAEWVNLNDQSFITGNFSSSGNGADTAFSVPHGLGSIPAYYQVTVTSRDAANVSYVTADNNFLIIHYSSPPSVGNNNLSWNWQVKR